MVHTRLLINLTILSDHQEKLNLKKHDQLFAIALPVNSVHKLDFA